MSEPLSRDAVVSVLKSFFVAQSRSPEIFVSASEPPESDAKLEWVKVILERNTIHDEDYAVFGHFDDRAATILDVGASYGYSAASIWASGASTSVISFEPIEGYESIFREIKRLREGRFDFMVTALGDHAGSIQLTTPVVNGRVAAALTTALPVPDLDGLAANIFRHAARRSVEITSLRLYQFTAPIITLDDALDSKFYSVSTEKIVALKIDTEGFEAPVIAGATRMLGAHKPLIMVEGGCFNPRINEILLPMGYAFAARTGRNLHVIETPVPAINGFYVHKDQVSDYRVNGLLPN